MKTVQDLRTNRCRVDRGESSGLGTIYWWEIWEQKKVWHEGREKKKLNLILAKWRSLKGSCYWSAAEKKKTNEEKEIQSHQSRHGLEALRMEESLCVEIIAFSHLRLNTTNASFSLMIITNICRVLNSPQSTFITLIFFESCPLYNSPLYVLSHYAHQGNEVERSRGVLCVTQLISGGALALNSWHVQFHFVLIPLLTL